jgi:hypothetical protein
MHFNQGLSQSSSKIRPLGLKHLSVFGVENLLLQAYSILVTYALIKPSQTQNAAIYTYLGSIPRAHKGRGNPTPMVRKGDRPRLSQYFVLQCKQN